MTPIINRCEERFFYRGLSAFITTADGIVVGTVQDISPSGISVRNIGRTSFQPSLSYKVHVKGCGYSIMFAAKVCWVKVSGCREFLEIGFKILHPPYIWSLFFEKSFPEEFHDEMEYLASQVAEENQAEVV